MYILHQLLGFLYVAACAALLLASVFAVIKGRFRIFLLAAGLAVALFVLWVATLKYLLWAGSYPDATGMEGLGAAIMMTVLFVAVLASIVLAVFTYLLRPKT